MSEIELQDGCTFTANVIGTQLLLSLPDSTPQANADTIVLENGVQYIPIYLPETLPTTNVVSRYVINDSQLPLLNNSRQIILTEDQIVTLNQVSSSTLPANQFSPQILCLNAEEDHNEAECNDDRNVTVTIEAEEERSPVSANHAPLDDIVDPPDKTGPKVCDTCGLRFESRKLFKKHVLSHLLEKPFKCPHCPESFNHEYNYIPHVAIHNSQDPTCPVCNKRFSRLAGLKAHIMIHQCDDTLPCPECLEEFSSQKLLDAHRLEHKSGFVKPAGKTHFCAICEEKFSSKALLKEHVHDAHKVKIPKKVKKGKGGYVCEFCKKRFEKPSQLVRHRRTHTGEKPFKCAECGKGFGQKGSLQIHMLKHSGVRPYACKYCSSQFSQKGNLQAHIQRIHPEEKDEMRKMHCKYCSCVFRNIVALHTHMSRNHGVYISSKKGKTITYHVKENTIIADVVIDKDTSNKENEAKTEQPMEPPLVSNEVLLTGTDLEPKLPQDVINQCRECSRTFKKRADLVKHLKIHAEEKLRCEFMCECGLTFKYESQFLSHVKTAHPPLDFSCDLCPDKFATLDELKSHRLKHLMKHQKDDQTSSYSEEGLRTHSAPPHGEELHPQMEDESANVPASSATALGDNSIEIECAKLLITADGSIEVIHDADPPRDVGTENVREAAEKLPEVQEVIEEPTIENHDETRKYKCDHCNMAFKQLSHWKTHLRIHTGEKPFSCNACEKTFASKSALTTHLATHELPSNCCEDCGKAFSSSRSLKRHMELHVLGFPYSCSVCSRSYKTKVAWQKHLTTHIKITPQQQGMQGKVEAGEKPTQKPESSIKPELIPESEVLMPEKGKTGNTKDVTTSSSFQGDWNDLMQSLQPSQQFNFTGDQNFPTGSAGTSIKTAPTSASSQEPVTTVRFGELGERTQLLTPLNDQAFDGCVFLQNSGDLRAGAQNLTSSASTVISQPQVTSSHRCSLCDVSFDNLVALSIHKTTHVQDKWSSCSTCNTVFSSYQVFQAHKKDCTPGETSQQEETNQDYLSVDLLSSHLHKCEPCSIHFFQANDYVSHVDTHHGAYACKFKLCSSWFKTSAQLEVHQLCHKLRSIGDVRESESEESIVSKTPSKSYKPSVSLEVALDSGSERKSSSSERFSSSKERLELKRKRAAWRRQAIRTLTEEEQEEVTKASPSSISERILQQSILRLKVPRPEPEAGVHPNQCKYCPKSFRKPSDLVRHLRVHTGERPYTCTSCNKSFSIKSTAKSHIKIHKKERSYSCHICHNHFAAIGSLKVHMRLHTGAKPFACDFCPARFRTSGHRKSHLLSHLRKDNNSNSKDKLVIPLSGDLTAPSSPRRKTPSPSVSDYLPKTDDSGDFAEQPETDPLEPSKQLSSSQFLFSLDAPLEFGERPEASSSQQFFLKEIKGDDQAGTAAHFVVTMTDEMSYQDNINDLLESVPNLNDHEDRFKLDLDLDVPKEQLPERSCEACTVCGKGFDSELELDTHMKKDHFSSSPLSCNVCKQTFAAKTDLELHILVHELDHLSCHSCSLGFPDESALRKHKCSNEDSNMKSMPSAPLDLASVVNEFFSFPAL